MLANRHVIEFLRLIVVSITISSCLLAIVFFIYNPNFGVKNIFSIVVFSIFYGAQLSLVYTVCLLVYRVLGFSVMVPMILIPLSIYLIFQLGDGYLVELLSSAWNAMESRAESFPERFEGIKVKEISIMLIIIVVMATIHFFGDWQVSFPLIQFILASGFYVCAGIVLGAIVSLPLMVVLNFKKIRKFLSSRGWVR